MYTFTHTLRLALLLSFSTEGARPSCIVEAIGCVFDCGGGDLESTNPAPYDREKLLPKLPPPNRRSARLRSAALTRTKCSNAALTHLPK